MSDLCKASWGTLLKKINFQMINQLIFKSSSTDYISPRKQVFVHQSTARATRPELVSVFSFIQSPKQTKMRWSPEKDVTDIC